MIRVTIEIVPFGKEDRARKIGTLLLANDGEGTHETGNYAYVYGYTDRDVPMARGTIKKFPRSQGAWALIKKILNSRSEEDTVLTDLLMERLESYKGV
jgi:hypothetical protein